MKRLWLWAGAAFLALSATAQAANVAPGKVLAAPSLTAAQLSALAASAKPAEMIMTKPPSSVMATSLSATFAITDPPKFRPGSGPTITTSPVKATLPTTADTSLGAQNYGSGRAGSVYQYTDSLVLAHTSYPFRASGWFYFTDYSNHTFRCTATLISATILITAGHCVHDQYVHGSAGWIKSGWFAPDYYNSNYPYGYAYAGWVNTTGGWYNSGSLDQGYDVGIVVLNARAGTSNPMGNYVGWQGYCYSGCLQSAWYLTQLGYPYNYYAGNYMIQGEHLEISDGRDYVFGSGQLGGSSGGPNSANLGSLSDSAVNTGQWPYRNYVFAVTSWGYDCTASSCTTAQKNAQQQIKIQGASTLSGPSNANNFPALWNSACNQARARFGTSTCGMF